MKEDCILYGIFYPALLFAGIAIAVILRNWRLTLDSNKRFYQLRKYMENLHETTNKKVS